MYQTLSRLTEVLPIVVILKTLTICRGAIEAASVREVGVDKDSVNAGCLDK